MRRTHSRGSPVGKGTMSAAQPLLEVDGVTLQYKTKEW